MSKLQDQIRSMIEDALNNSTWTSASPGHTNTIKKVTFSFESPLDDGINEIIPETDVGRETQDSNETVARYKDSGVEDVSRFSQEQIGNLNAFVRSPFQFVLGVFSRGLVRGVGVAALFIAIGKLIEAVINEMFAPGRPFEVQFRQVAQQEILKFTEAREQAEIRQGFRQIIVTTIGGLRGSSAAGQIGGNFYRDAIPDNRIDPQLPLSVSAPNLPSQGIKKATNFTQTGQANARARQKGP